MRYSSTVSMPRLMIVTCGSRLGSSSTPGGGGGGSGIANNKNILWGDYQIIDRSAAFAVGERLVAIEAAGGMVCLERCPAGGIPSQFTFYTTLAGTNGADQRERLGARWGGRYDLSGGARTDLVVWRDPPAVVMGPLVTRGATDGFPLGQARLFVFDDDEDFVDISEFLPFPFVTNRTQVDTEELSTPYTSGWILLDVSTFGGNTLLPRGVTLEGQGYMTVLQQRNGAGTAIRGLDLLFETGPAE
jgi:hypothetical protein